MKQVSCGVVFIDTVAHKILMVHPTNQKDFWDLPKGRREVGETPLEAAIREVEEETSIELDTTKDIIFDCGEHTYNKHKNVHLFVCLDKEFNIANLTCDSMVDGKDGHVFPEVDDYQMFSLDDAIDKMCPSMKKVFIYEVENQIRQHLK